MQEWKIKQEIYHRLNQDYTDDLNKVNIVITDDIKKDALRHFFEYVDEWIYPSKSYVVAYCYAYWISQEYEEDFWELLKDPMLLAGNDPYYKTIDEDTDKIYQYLFDNVDWPIPMLGMVPDIKEYYDAEIGSK
jgi:hypothetical protein